MTNATLVALLKSLPLSNQIEALKALVKFDRGTITFDEFILAVMSFLDFSKLSPLKALIGMTLAYDGTETVTKVAEGSMAYIPTLLELPTLFSEEQEFSEFQAVSDLTDFFFDQRCDENWLMALNNALEGCGEMTIGSFLAVLERLDVRFMREKITACGATLKAFLKAVSVGNVRMAFCKSQNYRQIMMRLFSKGLAPGMPNSEFTEMFGEQPMQRLGQTLPKIDDALELYHDNLTGIMFKLLLKSTKDYTFGFIREVLEKTYFTTSRSMPDAQRYDPIMFSVGYNMTAVLMKCSFRQREKWVEVDPLTPYRPNTLAPLIFNAGPLAVRGVESWVAEENKAVVKGYRNAQESDDEEDTEAVQAEWTKLLQQSDQEPAFVSQFFFATVLMLENSACRTIDLIQGVGRQLEFSVKPRVNDPSLSEMERARATYEKNELEKLFCYFRFIYVLPKKLNSLLEFLGGLLDFLLRAGNYSTTEKRFETRRPPLAYQHLPEALADVATRLTTFLHDAGEVRPLDKFLARLGALFSNRRYLPNPEMGQSLVGMFASVAGEGRGGNSHLTIMPTFLKQVYPAVVDFYSRVQVTGTAAQYYERDSIRRRCVQLLSFWFRLQEPRLYFQSNFQSETNRNFLFYLVQDATSHIGKIVDNFIHYDDSEAREQLKQHVDLATLWIQLLESIAGFAPEALNDSKLVISLPTLILSFFRKYTMYPAMQNRAYWQAADGSRDYFLTAFAGIAVKLRNVEGFMKNFVQEDYLYTNGLYEQIAAHLAALPQNDQMVSLEREFAEFISLANAQKVAPTEEEIDIDYDAIPEEFQDMISYDIIRDPMLLPTGTNVSRSTLEQLKMNGCIDPNKNIPFKLEDVVPNPDLKARIDAWIAEYRETHS